uniref:hypothetical protein n=1 Tax=uncultured Dysgonomonas sp. TaxID=206096 RepID=UPI00262C03ED|nr:hypothetical protein [uncultured Dysgonomonas sp.]
MKSFLLLVLTLLTITDLFSQDNYFRYNGGADVDFRCLARGSGGRALVHDTNNTLTLNYENDFTGGVKIGSKLIINGYASMGVDIPTYTVGEGSRLYFRGVAANTDEMFIFKFNRDANKTDLRVNIGDDGDGDDRFVIGNTFSGTTDWRNFFVVLNNGRVGIGTEDPTEKLDVRGTISATEVKVQVLTGADHVFNTNYDLKPLSEVKAFVEENKHLPEIPSEKHMQENGLNVNEFQIKLLQKIEELTLYVIKQDEEIQKLKEALSEK